MLAEVLIARLSEAHAWAFFVFVDEDDTGILQCTLYSLEVGAEALGHTLRQFHS